MRKIVEVLIGCGVVTVIGFWAFAMVRAAGKKEPKKEKPKEPLP